MICRKPASFCKGLLLCSATLLLLATTGTGSGPIRSDADKEKLDRNPNSPVQVSTDVLTNRRAALRDSAVIATTRIDNPLSSPPQPAVPRDDACTGAMYSNGSYDSVDAISSERRADGSLSRWIVDDVLFTANVTITDLHWWGNEPIAFNWGSTVDYIILSDNAGVPGTQIAGANDVVATRVDTGVVLFGDPVWLYSIVGLNIPLPAGQYWIGMRPVQQIPTGGQGWWTTAAANGTSQVYLDYGPNTPAWDPGDTVFAGQYQVAFCITGFMGEEPVGACCDDSIPLCTDNVLFSNCLPPLRFAQDTTCANLFPACGQITGACCHPDDTCTITTQSECTDNWLGGNTTCDECPCIVLCPQEAVDEGEPLCDGLNDGCNVTPAAFGTIVPDGPPICGTADYDGATRDTDWYKFVVPADTYIMINFESEFMAVIGLVENCGIDDCNASTGFISPFLLVDPCSPVILDACLGPGTYYVFVGPNFDSPNILCGARYTISLVTSPCEVPRAVCCLGTGECLGVMTQCECEFAPPFGMGGTWFEGITSCDPNPCPQPPPNDTCLTAQPVVVPADVSANNEFATNDTPGTCGPATPGHGVWYVVQGTGNTMTASTCNPGTTFDTVIQVFCDCENLVCVGGNDDAAGAPVECLLNGVSRFSRFSWCSAADQLYYIHVGGYSTGFGNFQLTVTDDAIPCTPPVSCAIPQGRCCFGDPVQCVENSNLECTAMGGQWTLGLTCATTCPVPVTNETCLLATDIVALPYSISFDNNLSTADGPPGSCNTTSATVMQNDAWFKFTPAQDCFMSLAVNTTTYDGIIAMYQGPDCDNLVEFACLDEPDNPATWSGTVTAQTTYWFQVGDWGTSEGGGVTDFTLDCVTVLPCDCPADVDGDAYVDGRDVGPFTECLLNPANGPGLPPVIGCQCGDLDGNMGVTMGDISAFVMALLNDTGPCITGACCLPSEVCIDDLGQPECAALGGFQWHVNATCAQNPCPEIPPNDSCATAEDLPLNTIVIVDTTLATDDPQSVPLCGTASNVNQAVWYKVVGTGNTLTATTCNAGGGFNDTMIQVWCNTCDNLMCAAGNDDATCAISGVRSTTSWCSALGQTYYIAVGGYSANAGLIALSVTEGSPCADPPVCTPPTGACCVDAVCVATNLLPECNTLGGVWYVNEDCATFVCPDTTGNICDTPFVVDIPALLPYADPNTTCGRGNEYSNTCMLSYDGAEDAIYQLNVTAQTCVNISVQGGSIWTGVAIDDSCPLDPTTCLAKATTSGNPDVINGLSLAPGVYFIMIDTWPTPNCDSYTLSITQCP